MNNKVIWTFQVLLALWFVMPAYLKLSTPTEKLVEMGQLPPGGDATPIRVLGFLEAMGVIGIIAPRLFKKASILTPITAVCFALVMVGAFVVHFTKQEFKVIPLIVLAFALSVSVAWFRFKEKIA